MCPRFSPEERGQCWDGAVLAERHVLIIQSQAETEAHFCPRGGCSWVFLR